MIFPVIKYEWNTFLLETIVKKYLREYKIISPDFKDRRYQKSIIVGDKYDVHSYPELVAVILKEKGYEEI